MTKVIYEIVEHDGGWAYRVDGVFSETFPSHDVARKAAERAAREQVSPGETAAIALAERSRLPRVRIVTTVRKRSARLNASMVSQNASWTLAGDSTIVSMLPPWLQ